MSISTRRIGGLVLFSALVASCARTGQQRIDINETRAQAIQDLSESLPQPTQVFDQVLPQLSTPSSEQREKDRKWAIQNRYLQHTENFVSNPAKYKVNEDDIDFIIGKKMILQDRETGDLEFVEDNKENQARATKENKQIIRRDNTSYFNLGIGKNPWTTEIIQNNEEVRKRVQAFLVDNLHSNDFVLGLGMNENDYPIDAEIIDACTRNPQKQATFYFAQKRGFQVNDTHRQIVREHHQYPLSQGVVRNRGYVKSGLKDVPQADKRVCREHPKSDVAAVLSGLDIYQFEEADMEAAVKTTEGLDDMVVEDKMVEDDTSSYAANIVKKLNRPVTRKEISVARNKSKSDFAQVAVNRFYIVGRKAKDIKADIDLAMQLAEETHKQGGVPCPAFAEELFANPALPLTDRLINFAMNEPYCYVGTAEALAEREDFPLTEQALSLAQDKPYSSFGKGIKTHIAIQELDRVINETKELLATVGRGELPEEKARLVKVGAYLISRREKEIEAAKGHGYPAEKIDEFRQMIENLRQELEK